MSILGAAKKENKVAPVRMWIYGTPNVGKTHFSSQFPKALLLSTDGNYVYESIPSNSLDSWEVGPLAKDDQKARGYINILEALKVSNSFETVILDLVDGAYRLVRNHYLKQLKITHEGDLGYGKGYSIIRENFISGIEQLFKLPLNVIILSHEKKERIEPKNAAAYDVFKPALDDKFHETFEGYCNIVARLYLDQDEEGNQIRKLSLSPKDNEYGINRLAVTDDLILTHNGDNYSEFLEVWNKIYSMRGLNGTVETNQTRVNAKKEQIEGKKARDLAEVKRTIEVIKDEPVVKEEVPVVPNKLEVVDEVKTPVEEVKTLTSAEKLAKIKEAKAAKVKEDAKVTAKVEEVLTKTIEAEPKDLVSEEDSDGLAYEVTPETQSKLERIRELKRLKLEKDNK